MRLFDLCGVWAQTVWATGPCWPSSVRGGLDSAQWICLISNMSVVTASTALFCFLQPCPIWRQPCWTLHVAVALVVKLLRQHCWATSRHVTVRDLSQNWGTMTSQGQEWSRHPLPITWRDMAQIKGFKFLSAHIFYKRKHKSHVTWHGLDQRI